jgi:hypothetical protein
MRAAASTKQLRAADIAQLLALRIEQLARELLPAVTVKAMNGFAR